MAWKTGYNRRLKFTKDFSATLASDESNFAVPVNVSVSTRDFWSNIDVSGAELDFTSDDGTTSISFEVESFDATADDAWFWVKIPTVSGSGVTTFYLYYDKFGQTTNEDETSVWDSSYVTVLHLNEDNARGAYDNSTGVATFDGTNGGTTDRTVLIDKGRNFDGTDDSIILATGALSAELDTRNAEGLTTVVVVDIDTLDGITQTPFFLNMSGGGNNGFGIDIHGVTDVVDVVARSTIGDSAQIASTSGTLTAGNTYHFIAIADYTTDKIKLWQDGVLVIDASVTFGSATYIDSNDQTVADRVGGSFNSTIRPVDGGIDAFSFSSVARSDNWCKATWLASQGGWTISNQEVFFKPKINIIS